MPTAAKPRPAPMSNTALDTLRAISRGEVSRNDPGDSPDPAEFWTWRDAKGHAVTNTVRALFAKKLARPADTVVAGRRKAVATPAGNIELSKAMHRGR